MKLTFNEVKEFIGSLDEAIYRFESTASKRLESEDFNDVFMQHGMMQRASRELKLLIEEAKMGAVTDINGEPISYVGLQYFLYDLSSNKDFFNHLSNILDETKPVIRHAIKELFEHADEGHTIFEEYLEDFEESHLIEVDDELYMHLQEWV